MKAFKTLALAALTFTTAANASAATNLFVEGRVRDDESCPSLYSVDGAAEDGTSVLKCVRLSAHAVAGPKARRALGQDTILSLSKIQKLGTAFLVGTVTNDGETFVLREVELMGE